ncbi:MAG: glycosyltransferase family 39 protein [Deltaproteobacteria bacterium]|nr:glycosyltransferase family 39 protein [Deltaproteobacteria bacterium]
MSGNHTFQRNGQWKDYLLIVLLTAAIYLPFLGLSRWDDNEPLRVAIAKEMLSTGDWLVPFLHGRPYLVKPPMMNWLIAGSGYLLGGIDEWTGRLPSVIAVFLLGISMYLFTGKWLSREGRLFSAIATVSMFGLMEKGRTAEIDALFVFLVTLTLLVWINGYERRLNPVLLWCASLALAGIGTLTKGPQAIAYLYSTVFVYLLARKRLSFFFSAAHLAGIAFFTLILALYLSHVSKAVALSEYARIVMEQITQRAEGKHSFIPSFIFHFISYPFTITATFLPWVLFAVPAIAFKKTRGRVKGVMGREVVIYSLIAIAVNFPVYWLLPGAKARYFLPAGPFAAIITAALFEFYLEEAREEPGINAFFKRFMKVTASLALLCAVLTPVAVAYMDLSFSLSLTAVTVSTALVSIFILYKVNSAGLKSIPLSMALTVGLTFLIYSNIKTQLDTRKDNNPRNIAREINLLLPENVGTLYSMGYRNILEVMCYMDKKVVQVDTFRELKNLAGKDRVYFIFTDRFLKVGDKSDKRFFEEELEWEKAYSKYLDGEKGKVVVGYIEGNKPLP